MDIRTKIDNAVTQALAEAGILDSPAVVRQAQRPEFGQYQVNGIMGAAKKLDRNPRELATEIVSRLLLPEARELAVAGPGFINIHLSPGFIASELLKARHSEGLAIEPQPQEKIAVDYSSPNLMKEMHIGHLRTTAIGDAVVRILEFLGHHVIRVNHVGDWGAQFGSLLAYLDQLDDQEMTTQLKDLEKFYRAASKQFRNDPEFAIKARQYVVRLQSGDERCLKLWRLFIKESIRHCQEVYERLDITLGPQDIRAESSYNEDLPLVVEELQQKNLLKESEGALCVFLNEFKGKDGNPLPAIIRKSDGGYPYMATDLAAVRYRSRALGVDKALYVVGAPQTLHFQQVFAVATAAGYINDRQEFKHLAFGSILNHEGRMFKTRDGADVKLIDVIEESISRAFDIVSSKNPDLPESQKREIARVVGVGAMKYAELSKNRVTDYIFDWNTMLSFDGNTAPYLQYAYTRIRSIFRRADVSADALTGTIILTEQQEFQLGIKLLQFSEALNSVLEDHQPNLLCNYLYELAVLFMGFYEACPILKSDDATRQSRLVLCDITARTLRQGLNLLGIYTVEQM